MKKITRHILKSVLFLTVLFNSIVLSAQIGKPVTVIVSLTPPYTPFLNEYASFETNKLQVTLITNDSRMQNYPVKLQMFVQRYGTGIVMQTAEYAAVPPIYLTGGTSEILDGASLSPYFSAQNNVFGGFDQSQYIQTGRIPDGQYRIGFRVTDAKRSNVILSETVYSQPGWFLLNDPPQLNLPLNGAAEEVQNIQNVKLEWFPRHLGSLNSAFAVNYLAELYALRVPGTNPATVVASLPPDFTVVTRQNSFNLTQNEYVLEPGVEYAWRVKAYADNGLTLFQNNGYSEVRTFVYGSLCPEVENIHADILGTEEVEFSWDTDPKQTAWEIQLRKENSEDNWYTRQTSTVPLNIKNILSEGTAYEYRIKALCNFNESDYSPLKSFSTEVFQLPENFECGAGDSIEITNFNPKLSLYVGEIIYNGKFPVKLTEINGSNGTFSGKGRMRIPMLANVQVNMQFENIKVNELNQVYEGEMVSVYNPDSPFFIDDITDYFAEGDQVGNIITGQDSAAITLGYPIDDNTTIIINNNGTITINTGEGSTAETVDDLENGTTIEDSEGNLYAVDADGNITEIGTSGDDVSPEDYSNNANQYNQLDSTITLTFENNGTWAFDSRNPDYANSPFDKEYQKLGDYYVPWKFIPLGKSDKIKARITKGNIEDPNKVKFLTPAGTEFFAEYNNGYYELEATGGKIGDGIEVYAIYMPDDSTKRSLGKLRIASYPHKEMKVTCVPAGDFNIDNKISEALLNQIYAPYYINWTVTLDEPFTDNSWDTGDEGLQVSGSGFWSEYTEEMRALRDVYTEKRGIDEESLYLFFFPNGNSDENQLLGDMPLKSRFGFIFNVSSESKEKIARTVAHELAHGAFQLKHTFSNKYKIKKYSTQNLTDYNGGTELVKYQWDVIHDPQNKLFNWMQGEGEGEMRGIDYRCIPAYISKEKTEEYYYTNSDEVILLNSKYEPFAFVGLEDSYGDKKGGLAVIRRISDGTLYFPAKNYKKYHGYYSRTSTGGLDTAGRFTEFITGNTSQALLVEIDNQCHYTIKRNGIFVKEGVISQDCKCIHNVDYYPTNSNNNFVFTNSTILSKVDYTNQDIPPELEWITAMLTLNGKPVKTKNISNIKGFENILAFDYNDKTYVAVTDSGENKLFGYIDEAYFNQLESNNSVITVSLIDETKIFRELDFLKIIKNDKIYKIKQSSDFNCKRLLVVSHDGRNSYSKSEFENLAADILDGTCDEMTIFLGAMGMVSKYSQKSMSEVSNLIAGLLDDLKDATQIPPKYYNPELPNYNDILFKLSFASMIEEGYYTSYSDIDNTAKIKFAYNCGLYNGLINQAFETVKVVAYIGKIVSEKQFRTDLYEGFTSLSVQSIIDKVEKDFSGNIYEQSEQAGEYVVIIASFIIPLSEVGVAAKIRSLSTIIKNLPKTAIRIFKDLEAKAIKKFIFKGDDIAYFVYKELNSNIAKFDGNKFEILKGIPDDLINKNTIYLSADEISIVENGVTYNAKFKVIKGTKNGEDYVGIKRLAEAGGKLGTLIDDAVIVISKNESLPTWIKQSFKDGKYVTVQTNKNITIYRDFGGSAFMDGSFSTTINNATRNELALHESFGNSMRFKSTIEVPSGEVLNIGKVGPYPPGSPNALPGGADQILLPENYSHSWIKEIIDTQTGQIYTVDSFKQAFPYLIKNP